MAATARAVAGTLLRAGLAAAVLAIIAGIFGMHVMTGNHAAHGTHTAAVHASGVHASGAQKGAVHAEHGPADHQEQPSPAAPPAGATSCEGSCQSMQEAGTSCIPSAQAGTLALFPPHQTGAAFHAPAARGGPAVAYAYTPPSPTPGDLSISRT
ncbi:hypothetical protein [Pseudarthrobacter sulfonivorans]|uniref:hypothetical protein n=1 Tax=Pseudarthrobacter sulfonivorans TaxID=121292 RepID=UPI002858953C|nr:hypothetical protein [Pseudarthrobacter sulfonivorans]MDR6414942.1 hypothetical protein [Pseudarthrobacter sulfonivorans]